MGALTDRDMLSKVVGTLRPRSRPGDALSNFRKQFAEYRAARVGPKGARNSATRLHVRSFPQCARAKGR